MILDYVSQYVQSYGYFVIFAALFIAMIGIPAPEETLMVLIGGMLLESGLHFIQVIAVALLAANTAMLLTYLTGRKFGNRLVSRYGHKVQMTPAKWERMKRKLEKYDGISVVFTYFVPGIRQLVPFLSGIRKVSYTAFFLFTFTGSLLWTVFYTTIGYYLGGTFGSVFLGWYALGMCVLFVGIILSKRFAKSTAHKDQIVHK